MLRSWLELARVSNLPTVWTNVLAGWLLAGGRWETWSLIGLCLAGSLMYTAGMILNDAADVRWDRMHRKDRPIPSGKVSLATAWLVGVSMLLGGAALFVWQSGACIWLTGALGLAIILYDLFHKPWAGSVFIMGACRTLLLLAAGSAVTGGLGWESHTELCVKSMALGAYIVGVSLAARGESRKHQPAARSRCCDLSSIGPLALAAPVVTGIWYGGVYGDWIAALLGLGLLGVIHLALAWMRENPAWIGRAVSLLLACVCLVDAAASAPASILAVPWCLVCLLLAMMAQRKIAAT